MEKERAMGPRRETNLDEMGDGKMKARTAGEDIRTARKKSQRQIEERGRERERARMCVRKRGREGERALDTGKSPDGQELVWIGPGRIIFSPCLSPVTGRTPPKEAYLLDAMR